MSDKDIYMWIQNGDVVRGELNFEKGTLVFFGRDGNILLKRSGLTRKQLTRIKKQIEKKLDSRNKVGFYYLMVF